MMRARSPLVRAAVAAVLAVAVAGCHQDTPPGHGPSAAPSAAPNFELICDAADTNASADLRCVRTDTRTGDILVVNYRQLPVSNGSTASAPGAPGTYTTACRATSMPNRADFYCIRLNTRTGDLMMVNLPKVGAIPASQPKSKQ